MTILERISRTGYWSDFYIYPLFILLFIAIGIKYISINTFIIPLLYIFGIIFWSFIEYIVHRFLFHRFAFLKKLHDAHHNKPTELIGTPTYMSLPIYTVMMFLPLYLFFGLGISSVIYSGILTGAFLYFFIHHSTHHIKSRKGALLFYFKKHHSLHHLDSTQNYSVTLPIWDRIFRTKK
ncbi:fatty acid hydroxylase family protein [Francisella sp. Scap27]|uniref:sterol desaturase family protein n=1 Tax=Francisella sp. Scap27 TaxID=2589986 RepID=UPI003564FA28|nr:fatty acid hydroxylase family protein [Francisella sp. Scap27]